MTVEYKRQYQRTATAAQWSVDNPVLASGEIGVESDTLQFKVGDGVRAWTALPYPVGAVGAVQSVDGKTGAVNLSGAYVAMAAAPSGDTTGATDTAALQAALNAAVAASAGQTVTLQLQRGTYWVKIATSTVPNGGWALTLPTGAAGVEVVGAGQALTTVKMAASQGSYRALMQAGAGDLGVLTIRDLAVDHNEQNNSSHTTQANLATDSRMTLSVSVDGSGGNVGGASGGVNIRRVTVTNFDSTNCFSIHGDKGINLGPVTVEDCRYAPAAITGGNDHDHSTIYWQETVSLFAGCMVRGNRFRPATAGLPQLGAAIECHGSGYTVENNDVLNYPVGVQATAVSFATTEDAAVRNNRMRGVAQGVAVVVAGLGSFTSGLGLNGMRITDNDMLIDRDQWWGKANGLVVKTGCGVLFNQPAAAFEVRDVSVDRNRIRFAAITQLATGTDGTLSHGVAYYRPSGGTDTRIRIRGNTIEGAPQNGLYLNPSAGVGFETEANTIIDPGSISDAASTEGIFLAPAVSLADSALRGDRIIDTKATPSMTYGINLFTGNPITNCQVLDPQVRIVHGSQVPVVTQGTAAGTQWFLRARQQAAPFTYAAYGSTVTDDSAGAVYMQTVSPGGGTWTALAIP